MFISLINKDEDLAKYIKDNDCLKKMKNFQNVSSKLEKIIDKSPSIKQMELCRPISGIKKLIQTHTNREESPDSTVYENETKENDFDISKIILNSSIDNMNKINNHYNNNSYKNINKNDLLRKSEETSSKPNPQKMSRENSLFNYNLNRKESLIPIKENIEVIAEEDNNEFLLTGMKFNISLKKHNNSFYFNTDTENNHINNSKSPKKKHSVNEILPPLLKKSSTILSQNFRNSILFGKNDDGTFKSPVRGKYLYLLSFIKKINKIFLTIK